VLPGCWAVGIMAPWALPKLVYSDARSNCSLSECKASCLALGLEALPRCFALADVLRLFAAAY
jgi:hypothetical protein